MKTSGASAGCHGHDCVEGSRRPVEESVSAKSLFFVLHFFIWSLDELLLKTIQQSTKFSSFSTESLVFCPEVKTSFFLLLLRNVITAPVSLRISRLSGFKLPSEKALQRPPLCCLLKRGLMLTFSPEGCSFFPLPSSPLLFFQHLPLSCF